MAIKYVLLATVIQAIYVQSLSIAQPPILDTCAARRAGIQESAYIPNYQLSPGCSCASSQPLQLGGGLSSVSLSNGAWNSGISSGGLTIVGANNGPSGIWNSGSSGNIGVAYSAPQAVIVEQPSYIAAPAQASTLTVVSGSPVYDVPCGVTISSENTIGGTVAVQGTMPFCGSSWFEGSVPSEGAASVAYSAGSGASLQEAGCGLGLGGSNGVSIQSSANSGWANAGSSSSGWSAAGSANIGIQKPSCFCA